MLHHRNFSLGNIISEIDGIVYTEEWRPTNEASTKYNISSFGRLKRLAQKSKNKKEPDKIIPEKIVAGGATKKGYRRFILKDGAKKYSRYAHRLVALAFITPVDGKPCVNHKTAIKTDNHYAQLEWCTDEENNKHAWALGIFEGSNSLVSKEGKKFIVDNFDTLGREALMKKFSVSEKYILSVVRKGGIKINGTTRRRSGHINYKPIINSQTGEIYPSAEFVFRKDKMKSLNYFWRQLRGDRPNPTPYKYV